MQQTNRTIGRYDEHRAFYGREYHFCYAQGSAVLPINRDYSRWYLAMACPTEGPKKNVLTFASFESTIVAIPFPIYVSESRPSLVSPFILPKLTCIVSTVVATGIVAPIALSNS
jgi:hypothetical protein